MIAQRNVNLIRNKCEISVSQVTSDTDILMISETKIDKIISTFVLQVQKQLDVSCKKYEHFLFMGDFNANVFDPSMNSFCTLFKLKKIAKKPTYYKKLENPSCIDLVLTNCPRSFHNICVYQTGLSLLFIIINFFILNWLDTSSSAGYCSLI